MRIRGNDRDDAVAQPLETEFAEARATSAKAAGIDLQKAPGPLQALEKGRSIPKHRISLYMSQDGTKARLLNLMDRGLDMFAGHESGELDQNATTVIQGHDPALRESLKELRRHVVLGSEVDRHISKPMGFFACPQGGDPIAEYGKRCPDSVGIVVVEGRQKHVRRRHDPARASGERDAEHLQRLLDALGTVVGARE